MLLIRLSVCELMLNIICGVFVMNTIRIQNFLIGKENRPFIIAEMSGNHNHSLDRALAIVDAAAEAGVQALKLQTYTAETMTIDKETTNFL